MQTSLSLAQKLQALSFRFYQRAVWTPKTGDLYTTSRADLELYQIVDISDGKVFTRYCGSTRSEAVSSWPCEEFLSPETFGYARVWVPEWVFKPEINLMLWNPMSRAPRDGTSVLLNTKDGVVEGWFDPGEWTEDHEYGPQYEGAYWVCLDDKHRIDAEEWPINPSGYEEPVDGWLPLSTVGIERQD